MNARAGEDPIAREIEAARSGDAEVLVSCVVAPGFDFADFTLLPLGPASTGSAQVSPH